LITSKPAILIHIITISIITAITFFSGCAVKQEDSTATKALKHTANPPAYVIVGVGMATTLAIQGTLIGAAKLLGAGKKDEKLVSSEVEVKNQAEAKSSLTNENINTTNP
jgi:hypothetical protein